MFRQLRSKIFSMSSSLMKTKKGPWPIKHCLYYLKRKGTRLHEEHTVPCLFGCANCKDELVHYVECQVLHALCKFMWDHHSDDPLVAFGFLDPQRQHFEETCCIFSGCHAMYREAQRDNSMHSLSTLTSPHRRRLWSVFAEAFRAEAGELSITVRQFSLYEFVSFLIDTT